MFEGSLPLPDAERGAFPGSRPFPDALHQAGKGDRKQLTRTRDAPVQGTSLLLWSPRTANCTSSCMAAGMLQEAAFYLWGPMAPGRGQMPADFKGAASVGHLPPGTMAGCPPRREEDKGHRRQRGGFLFSQGSFLPQASKTRLSNQKSRACGSRQLPAGRPALRQRCSRYCSRSQPCSTGTCGRKTPWRRPRRSSRP